MKKHLLIIVCLAILSIPNLMAQTGSLTTNLDYPYTIEAGTDLSFTVTYTSDVDCEITCAIFLTSSGTNEPDWNTWQKGYDNTAVSAATDGTADITVAIPGNLNSDNLGDGLSYILCLALNTSASGDFAWSNTGNLLTITESSSIVNKLEFTSTPPSMVEQGQEVTLNYKYSLAEEKGYIAKIALAVYEGYTQIKDIEACSTYPEVQGILDETNDSFTFTIPGDLELSSELAEGQRYVFEATLFEAGWNWLSINTLIDVTVSTSTGIDSNQNKELKLYPNPVKDMLTVEGAELGEKIKIYSSTGALIKTEVITNTSIQVEVSDLAKGMYFIQTQNCTVKFIKN